MLKLSEKQRSKIAELRAQGVTGGEIAKKFGLSTAYVYKLGNKGKKPKQQVVKEPSAPSTKEINITAENMDYHLAQLDVLWGQFEELKNAIGDFLLKDLISKTKH